MARTLKEALAARAAGVVDKERDEDVEELERILALPSRPPVDCQPNPRRWPGPSFYPPATVALIRVMTERYGRGSRLSCACRPRRVTAGADGAIVIHRVLPTEDGSSTLSAPLVTTVAAFVADNRTTAAEVRDARVVAKLRVGEEVLLPAADGELGHPCIDELNPVQAWILREAPRVGGAIGYCGVGSGKTIAGILVVLAFPDCKHAVILAEPGQRKHYRSFYLRLREHFRVPSMIFDEGEPYHVAGTPPLHFVPYSKLSAKASTDLLDQHAPDVVIADEAHRVCGDSARSRRVKRYLTAPRCRTCRARMPDKETCLACGPSSPLVIRHLPWSGTLESKSVEDSQGLAVYALGTGSPMPMKTEVAVNWSAVLDPMKMRDRASRTYEALKREFDTGARRLSGGASILQRIADGDFDPEEGIRQGFRQRRISTPGVISMSASSVNAAIYFTERVAPSIPDAVRKALRGVRGDDGEEPTRPDGDPLVTVVERVECARHVGVGFYNYWAFPKHPCSDQRAPGRCEPMCDQCLLIERWYAERKGYCQELRRCLQRGEAHLDSPDLCWNAAERFWRDPPYTGDLVKWPSEKWPSWSKIKDKVEHDERVRWIDDYLAQDAAKWAREHRGVVWCQSVAFGQRVAQLAGLHYHGGGPNAEAAIMAESGKRSVVASIKAHGSGRDGLQTKFSEQLIAEMPASNSVMEQLLGRLHRPGQRADVVKTEAYLQIAEFKDALRQCISQAEFVRSTTGNQQKILLADLAIEGL